MSNVLKNVSDQTVWVPGPDCTLEPGEEVSISDELAERIKSPFLAVNGESAEAFDLHQKIADDEGEPPAEDTAGDVETETPGHDNVAATENEER